MNDLGERLDLEKNLFGSCTGIYQNA